MTVKELRNAISGLPDEMLVTYNYDTGNAYPTFGAAYTARLAPYYDNAGQPVLILDESAPREYRSSDGLRIIDELLTKPRP